ncbi:MAG: hypothetical protein WDZ83_20390 [Rhizobiaceae bacterium]
MRRAFAVRVAAYYAATTHAADLGRWDRACLILEGCYRIEQGHTPAKLWSGVILFQALDWS